ncbi:MAG: hypothetical protein J5I93_29890 [Pirellulaceae bacterium]|nr:hypothetical protein [Pirellulaceae bacterium]
MKKFLCVFAGALLWAGLARGDEPTGGDSAEDAAYTLRYRFHAGETLRSEVVHQVTVETRIRGTTQVAKTRSAAVKVWKIQDVAENGHVTFEHSVAHVDMWQSVSGRQVIRYDSRQGQPPPPGYEAVAESIGVPLSTVTIDTSGRVVERKDNRPQFNPGIGELTVPLPRDPVKVGQQWSEPDEVRIHLPGEPQQRIKTRQLFTLRSVKTGIATIEVKTEVLTPLDDPAVEAQLVQRLQEGTVKFDLDAGRLVARQMDMDKTVVGFNGADSQMEYLARFSEQTLEGEVDSAAPEEPPAQAAENAKPVQGPEVRR